MKSWTYAEITEETITKIEQLKQQANTKAGNKAHLKEWAYGVYLGWYFLTYGWQEEGDKERMEQLTEF